MKLAVATLPSTFVLVYFATQLSLVTSASLDDTILKHRREAVKREVPILEFNY